MNAFLLTAGLAVVLQSTYRLAFGNKYRGITSYWPASIEVFGMNIAADRIMAFSIALVTIAGLWLFLQKSRLGRAIRAVSQDERGAMLMGIDLDDVGYLKLCQEKKLGQVWQEVELVGEKVEGLVKKFRLHQTAEEQKRWRVKAG